ncbi:MAG: RHS repeat-associated core domain-containing protein [Candidatus Edwardsbacteria bacterium]
MTDANGNVVQSYIYDEFGNLLSAYGVVPNAYLYAGQEYDVSPLNGYNLRAREYYPQVGRFGSEDRYWDRFVPQSSNLYIYALNDPINLTDISGLIPTCTTIRLPFTEFVGYTIRRYGEWILIGVELIDQNFLAPLGLTGCIWERTVIARRRGEEIRGYMESITCSDPCGDITPRHFPPYKVVTSRTPVDETRTYQTQLRTTIPYLVPEELAEAYCRVIAHPQ